MNKKVNIQIGNDYYAYITSDDRNLFHLIEKSFTRSIPKYNNWFRMWETKINKHYSIVNHGSVIKVDAGLVDFLIQSFKERGISYLLSDTRVPAKIQTNITTKLSDKVRLRDYQEEAVRAVFKSCFCCIQLPTGSGKEQPVTAKVLTPTGFKNIGDLQIGDSIIAGDGKVTKVIGKYPQGVKDVYKITFSDNTIAECGLNHIWTVSSIKNKKSPKFFDVTLKDILKEQQLNLEYGGRARDWRYEIPLATVEGKEKQFIIQPYTLGVLIADGSMCGKEVGFSCNDYDYDIKNRVLAELDPEMRLSGGKHYNNSQSCPQYKIVHKSVHICYNKFRQEVIRLGLNVKSKDKFIPKEYLYGTSISQRKALLQGLFDCDGTQAKNKATVSYCTTSLQLARDVVELIQSLGFTATWSAQDRTKENKHIEYNIRISSKDYCPFSLTRKAQYWRQSPDKTRRYIRKIELVRQEESVCIEVESKTKQYLTNNYIVTHNTEVSASIAKTYLNHYFDRAVLYVVPTIKLQKEAEERFTKYGLKCNTKLPFQIGYVNIFTYMSLVRSKDIDANERNKIGALVLDESQHLKGPKNNKIVHGYKKLNLCVGVSATITPDIEYKKQLNQLSDNDFLVLGVTGKPVYWRHILETTEDKFITPIDVTVLNNKEIVALSEEDMGDWHKIKRNVLMSPARANLVANFVDYICEQNRFYTLMLLIPEVVWSKQFMLAIASQCSEEYRYILMFGQDKFMEIICGQLVELKTKEQKEEAYSAIKNPNIKTIFSATSFAYEGLDIPNLQALVNVYGGRSDVRIKQQIGRLTRLFKGKEIGHIYEIHDKNPVCESQLKKRLNIYKNEYSAEIKKSDYGWWEEE